MAKLISAMFLAVLLLILFPSCSESIPSTQVLAGNMSYFRGQYQKSILHYLTAEDRIRVGKDVVYYNLANVYYALGEGDAALRTWVLAEDRTEDVDILFRIAFNRGVLYYNRGHFDESYQSFRRALTLNPGDIDAKINLEDAFSRIRTTLPQSGSSEKPAEGDLDGGGRHLMEYLQRKEAEAWTGETAVFDETAEDW